MLITDVLRVEHVLLRRMLKAIGDWLAESAPPQTMRERAVMLAIALDDHAIREEKLLFAPLRSRSETAHHLVDMMELVHAEVRDLFEEIADPSRDPKERLWTILQLTEDHFKREENEVFPLAETLIDSKMLEQLGET